MNHAVPNGVKLGQGLDDADLLVRQHGHDLGNGLDMVLHRNLANNLLASRLRIDQTRPGDANALDKPLAEHLLALHVEELELQRRRAAVDDENLLNRFHFFSQMSPPPQRRGRPCYLTSLTLMKAFSARPFSSITRASSAAVTTLLSLPLALITRSFTRTDLESEKSSESDATR